MCQAGKFSHYSNKKWNTLKSQDHQCTCVSLIKPNWHLLRAKHSPTAADLLEWLLIFMAFYDCRPDYNLKLQKNHSRFQQTNQLFWLWICVSSSLSSGHWIWSCQQLWLTRAQPSHCPLTARGHKDSAWQPNTHQFTGGHIPVTQPLALRALPLLRKRSMRRAAGVCTHGWNSRQAHTAALGIGHNWSLVWQGPVSSGPISTSH